MKRFQILKYYMPIVLGGIMMLSVVGCTDKLNEPFEDEAFTSDVGLYHRRRHD